MGVGLMGAFDQSGAVSRRLTSRVIRRVVVVAAIVAIAVSALAAAGSAAESFSNNFQATTTPGAVFAGASQSFNLTLTPQAGGDELASATVTPPAGFTITAASPAASTTVSGNQVLVHNVSIDPDTHQSGTFGITATAPCTSTGGLSWQVAAKDDDGRNYTLNAAGSSLGVTLANTCHLAFTGQPADALKSTAAQPNPITTTPINVPQGGPVAVTVEDGGNNPITTSTASIAVAASLSPPPPPPPPPPPAFTLSGTLTKSAVSGVASFSDLKLDTSLTYVLTASTTSPGIDPATSNAFTIWDSAQSCTAGKTCIDTLGDPTTFQTQFSGTSSSGGFLLLTLDQSPLSCGDTFNHAPSVTSATTYRFSATGPKQMIGTISKAVDQAEPNNGVSFYRVCFESTDVTFVYPGGVVHAMGTPFLLPNCKDVSNTPPCVQSITKTNAGAVKETITLPKDDYSKYR
jgi:hypothetical protein